MVIFLCTIFVHILLSISNELFQQKNSIIRICSLIFSDIWSLGDFCRLKQKEYEAKGMHCRRNCVPDIVLRRNNDCSDQSNAKRSKISDDTAIYRRNIAFFRAHYTTKNMPKCVLNSYATKRGFDSPIYTTEQEDRLFQSVVSFQNQKYASSYWEKNRRFAEQGAALVCILGLGLVTEEDLIENGSLTK